MNKTVENNNTVVTDGRKFDNFRCKYEKSGKCMKTNTPCDKVDCTELNCDNCKKKGKRCENCYRTRYKFVLN